MLINVLVALATVIAVTVGIGLGLAFASTHNIRTLDEHADGELALPTEVLDREGRLITEFFSSERRDLVSLDELPNHLVYALVTREDRDYFEHNGFSIRGTVRAAWNILAGQYVSGGSTLTQQLAGHMFDDRQDISITRKLRELWWAFQLERSWTKNEILEVYLNRMYFGHNTYGVEAASQFYFGHSARDLSPAESVMLVIQLANPARYSPIHNPQRARSMQRVILNQMASSGYISREDADYSFEEYWANYDFTRSTSSTAFLDREDEAPYFSEYVRGQLEGDILLGRPVDINRAGYVVHTTLDLDHQRAGERYLRDGIDRANASVRQARERALDRAGEIIPLLDMIGLSFDIPDLRVSDMRNQREARQYYNEHIDPMLSITSLLFDRSAQDGLYNAVRMSQIQRSQSSSRDRVQGAIVTLENDTGHITSMIGGNQFERIDQLNRAVQGRRTPGSAFKSLYYAEAIDSGTITPATLLYDSPVVFQNDDGSSYQPRNYAGNWYGPVLAREALARSLNIPAVRVFNRVGFTDALNTSARMLGISQDDMAGRGLERRYPVALGVNSVSPLEMARAYATFPNQGMQVDPLAIRYVEDQSGRIVAEPERDLRVEQRQRGNENQIISPEAAYIMTDMLAQAFETGTMRGVTPDVPMAAKSGTTQNWSDGWVVGYSPHYTTAVWFGFDRGGRSLGTNQYGAAIAGPVWGDFMNEIHSELEPEEFERPQDGIVEVRISEETGLLADSSYSGPTREELFIEGTEPEEYTPSEEQRVARQAEEVNRLRSNAELRGLLPSREQVSQAIPTLEEILGGEDTATSDISEPDSVDTDIDDQLDELDEGGIFDEDEEDEEDDDGGEAEQEGNPLLD
ncbi:MAG: penicillin-binding protein 1A [Spirochaetota bacterium]